MKTIGYLFSPLIFGLGFFAPLITQTLTAFDFSIAGISNIVIGLALGGTLGLIAQVRGSWIWIKP